MNEQNNNINPNPQPLNNGQIPVQPIPNQNPNMNNMSTQSPIQGPSTPLVNTAPTQAINPQPVPMNPNEPINQGMANLQAQPVQQNNMNEPVGMPNVNQAPPMNQMNEQMIPQNNQMPVNNTSQNPQMQQMNNFNNQNNGPQDINPQAQPINPIVNEPQSFQNAPVNGVFGPSVPIGGATNATNVGFVAAGSDIPKKKNKLGLILVILIIIAGLAALGYFVVYPYIMKNYFSDPKNVYETTIKQAFKGLNSTANDLVHNKGIYNLEASLDSNIESLADYVGYTYGINIGIDPIKKTIQEGLYIKNNSTKAEHSYYSYLKDNKYYDKYSSYRDYIYLGEAKPTDNLLALFDNDKLFNTSSNLNSEETNYVINKLSTLIVESIDEDKLSQEDASISINGENLKVTNNKYEIDYNTMKKMVEYIIDGLNKDDKTLEILSRMSNNTKEDIKKSLESIEIPENKEAKNIITTSIYTYGSKNEIVGFAVKDKEDTIDLYYYIKNNIVEAKLTYNYENELSNKTETQVIKMTSTKEKDSTKVTIHYDDKDINDSNKGIELLTLDIKSWDEKGINLDYSVTYEEQKINGTFKIVKDVNDERAKYSFDFSVKNGNQYISLSLNFQDDWTSEVANINTSAAATLNEEEIATHRTEFMNALKETPVGKLITTVSNEYDPSIMDHYNKNNLVDPNSEVTDKTQEKEIS